MSEERSTTHGDRRRVAGRRSSAAVQESELRDSILTAMSQLLATKNFGEVSVADILHTAGISRGSFYFYFDSKHDVLAELVERAVDSGLEAAEPWLSVPDDRLSALRQGTEAGAELWRTHAPVLRAIVENWQSDARLTTLWLRQMQSFTDATIAGIADDPEATAHLASQDVAAVASALTWLGERVYYLAACAVPPFDQEQTIVDTLTHIWASTLYGETGPNEARPNEARPNGKRSAARSDT